MRSQRLALTVIVTAAVVAALTGCAPSNAAAAAKQCTGAQIKALNPHDMITVTTKALPSKLPAEFNTALSGRSDIVCAAVATVIYRANGGTHGFYAAIVNSPISTTGKQLNKTLVAKYHIKPMAGFSWDGPTGSQTDGLSANGMGKKQTIIAAPIG